MADPAALSEMGSGPAGLAVSLRGVTKVYDNGVMALGPFDLDVRKGEFVSLLGPSGCGKSTALRLIAGLNAPTSGTVGVSQPPVEVRGRAFDRLRVSGADPDAVDQRAGECAAAAETGACAGRGGATRASTRRWRKSGLPNSPTPIPRELSGGMKMRVSLARALVTDPDILLMDEPFAALDEITRFRLNNDLLALWRDLRKTVIFVTHSVFESVYLSQRVIVMTSRPGRIGAEIRIDAAEPRGEDFRTSADYAGYCRKVSNALAPSYSGQPGS